MNPNTWQAKLSFTVYIAVVKEKEAGNFKTVKANNRCGFTY